MPPAAEKKSRKRIVRQPRISRIRVGNWWEAKLAWTEELEDVPPVKHRIPFDISLPIVGADNEGVVYSRTDKGSDTNIGGSCLVSEIPAGYVAALNGACVLGKEDAKLLICVGQINKITNPAGLNNGLKQECHNEITGKDRFQLLYQEADRPPQISLAPKGSARLHHSGWAEELQWIQGHPHIHTEWTLVNGGIMWAKNDELTQEEWEKLSYRVVTSRKCSMYARKDVAPYVRDLTWNISIPAATVEDSLSKLGLQPGTITHTDGSSLTTDTVQVVDHLKAVHVFQALKKLVQVKTIEPMKSGFRASLDEPNLSIFAQALRSTSVELGRTQIRFGFEHLDMAKVRGFILLDSFYQNHALTSGAEAIRLFMAKKKAESYYQLNNQVRAYWLTTPEISTQVVYLRADLEKYPIRDSKLEKKQKHELKKEYLARYPKLPRGWPKHSAAIVHRWQDIVKQADAGTLSLYWQCPLFQDVSAGTQGPIIAHNLGQWLLQNDSSAIQDPIVGEIYCAPYSNLDELAHLPNYTGLVHMLFPNSMIKALVLSQEAQAAVIASAL